MRNFLTKMFVSFESISQVENYFVRYSFYPMASKRFEIISNNNNLLFFIHKYKSSCVYAFVRACDRACVRACVRMRYKYLHKALGHRDIFKCT